MLLLCKILVADAILCGLLIAVIVPPLHTTQNRKVS